MVRFPSDASNPFDTAGTLCPGESQRAQRVIFTGWQPSFSASSFLFSAYLHDPCLKYAMKRRRCCESRGAGSLEARCTQAVLSPSTPTNLSLN